MAYVTSNPPNLITEAPLTGPGQMWVYRGTDTPATVAVAGYFSDGAFRGMKVGDIVIVFNTSATPITMQIMTVASVNMTTGAVDLTDGTAIAVTNAS